MLKNRGFALPAISFIVLCMGIVLSGTLGYYNTRNSVFKYSHTNKQLKLLEERLINFMIKHGRLPCPAPLECTVDGCRNSNLSFGVEMRENDECVGGNGVFVSEGESPETRDNVFYGAIPVNTLGLDNEYANDLWNHKILYAVPNDMVIDGALIRTARRIYDGTTSIFISTDGDGQSGVMFAVISLGSTKNGVYNMYTNSPTPRKNTKFNMPEDNFIISTAVIDNLVNFMTFDIFGDIALGRANIRFCEGVYENVRLTNDLWMYFDFQNTRAGKYAYSITECPKKVSTPPAEGDFYLISDSDIANKIVRLCWEDGTWSGDFLHSCITLPRCTLPDKYEGHDIKWDHSYPSYIVNTGFVSGTYGSNSKSLRMQCLVGYDGDTKTYGSAEWTVVNGG